MTVTSQRGLVCLSMIAKLIRLRDGVGEPLDSSWELDLAGPHLDFASHGMFPVVFLATKNEIISLPP